MTFVPYFGGMTSASIEAHQFNGLSSYFNIGGMLAYRVVSANDQYWMAGAGGGGAGFLNLNDSYSFGGGPEISIIGLKHWKKVEIGGLFRMTIAGNTVGQPLESTTLVRGMVWATFCNHLTALLHINFGGNSDAKDVGQIGGGIGYNF